MNCKTCQKHVSAFMDDELCGELRQAVTEHMTACAACRTAHDQLRSAWKLLDLPPEPEVPAYAHTRLRARMAQTKARSVLFRLERVLWPALTVAMLIAGAAVGGRAVQSADNAPNLSDASVAPEYLQDMHAGSLSDAYSDLLRVSETDAGGAL